MSFLGYAFLILSSIMFGAALQNWENIRKGEKNKTTLGDRKELGSDIMQLSKEIRNDQTSSDLIRIIGFELAAHGILQHEKVLNLWEQRVREVMLTNSRNRIPLVKEHCS